MARSAWVARALPSSPQFQPVTNKFTAWPSLTPPTLGCQRPVRRGDLHRAKAAPIDHLRRVSSLTRSKKARFSLVLMPQFVGGDW
jgi:hypothetical protein